MTNEIQELKNSLFSHYLLQDHDEANKNSTSKGVMHANGKYILDGHDLLGHRHPLYLKALVDCLELPTQLSQSEALRTLAPTIEYIKTKAGLEHTHFAIMNTKEADRSFWENWDYATTQSTLMIPLCLNTSVLFSEHEITSPSQYISSLAVAYQNRITKLFKEQNFLDENGRVHTLHNYLKSKIEGMKIPAQIHGLTMKVDITDEKLHSSFFFKKLHGENFLQFPIAVSNTQVDNIFQTLKGLL